MRAKFNSNDDKDEALFLVQNAQKAILSWKAHQLRTINQDRAKLDVLALIDSEDVLIVQDFAMKFMSSQYREAQSDFFGISSLNNFTFINSGFTAFRAYNMGAGRFFSWSSFNSGKIPWKKVENNSLSFSVHTVH